MSVTSHLPPTKTQPSGYRNPPVLNRPFTVYLRNARVLGCQEVVHVLTVLPRHLPVGPEPTESLHLVVVQWVVYGHPLLVADGVVTSPRAVSPVSMEPLTSSPTLDGPRPSPSLEVSISPNTSREPQDTDETDSGPYTPSTLQTRSVYRPGLVSSFDGDEEERWRGKGREESRVTPAPKTQLEMTPTGTGVFGPGRHTLASERERSPQCVTPTEIPRRPPRPVTPPGSLHRPDPVTR